ncbi:hypothetical protein HZS_6881, partial [Henneguya salminicola]
FFKKEEINSIFYHSHLLFSSLLQIQKSIINPPTVTVNKILKLSPLGFCKNVELANIPEIESDSYCGNNQKHCKINKSYNNFIEYRPQTLLTKNDVILNITVIIKTAGRYYELIKLCKTMWNYYPGIKTIIVDDFEPHQNKEFKLLLMENFNYLTYIAMNETIGISKG